MSFRAPVVWPSRPASQRNHDGHLGKPPDDRVDQGLTRDSLLNIRLPEWDIRQWMKPSCQLHGTRRPERCGLERIHPARRGPEGRLGHQIDAVRSRAEESAAAATTTEAYAVAHVPDTGRDRLGPARPQPPARAAVHHRRRPANAGDLHGHPHPLRRVRQQRRSPTRPASRRWRSTRKIEPSTASCPDTGATTTARRKLVVVRRTAARSRPGARERGARIRRFRGDSGIRGFENSEIRLFGGVPQRDRPHGVGVPPARLSRARRPARTPVRQPLHGESWWWFAEQPRGAGQGRGSAGHGFGDSGGIRGFGDSKIRRFGYSDSERIEEIASIRYFSEPGHRVVHPNYRVVVQRFAGDSWTCEGWYWAILLHTREKAADVVNWHGPCDSAAIARTEAVKTWTAELDEMDADRAND